MSLEAIEIIILMTIDLHSLSDEILSYSDDRFYSFIEESLGFDEMTLIKMQCIRNSRTLLNVPNVMSFLQFKSKEISELKHRICFVDDNDDKKFIVKAGIKAGIDYLISTLQEKRDKSKKQRRQPKASRMPLAPLTPLHDDQSNTSVLSTSSLVPLGSQPTSVSSTASNPHPLHHYLQKIVDSIEKFSLNTFENIILTNNIDYEIHLNIASTPINGNIKCGCNTTVKIPFRSDSNSFQLSAYMKHLKLSRCRMIKKKKQGLERISDAKQDLANPGKPNNSSNAVDIGSDDEHFSEDDDDSRNTFDYSLATDSDCSGRKRSLASRSESTAEKRRKGSK
jgi:hypothetical protein